MEDEVIILYDYFDIERLVSNNPFDINEKRNLKQKYFINKAWSANCILSFQNLEKIYIDIFGEPSIPFENKLGPFVSIDEIKRFGYKLCLEIEVERVYFLSVEKYNMVVQQTHQIKDLNKALLDQAEFLDNLERKNKLNLLDRIFN